MSSQTILGSIPSPSELVPIVRVVATGTAGYLAGLIASASLLGIPALSLASPSVATKQWAKLYSIGSSVAPPIAMLSLSSYLFLSFSYGRSLAGYLYLGAGLITFSIVPWTAIVMVATNNELHGLAEGKKEAEKARVDGLFRKWYGLNLARSLGPTIGVAVGLMTWAFVS